MSGYVRFILISLITAITLCAGAQSYSPQQIELAERVHSLSKNAASEIAYVQTSKDIYETGEDLWFKVYLLDAQRLVPSLRSKTLYLQLMNEYTRKIFWQEKYEIQNGFANGQVYLESTLPEGNYSLAVYTPNSFYYDSTEFKAAKQIKIVSDIAPATDKTSEDNFTSKQKPKLINKIQFTTFPEGGNLVSGIKSKLAFKAVNSIGEPVDITGKLYDDTSPLLEFKSTHAGMGSFSFIPEIGKKYMIRLSEPAIDSVFYLPEVYPTGMTLQLANRDKEYLLFKVAQSPELNPEKVYLRVQCRGVVYGMATGFSNGELWIKMPLAGLPQGIAEITLLNSSLMPQAERLVYINQDLKLNISAALSDQIYATRGKVTVKISAKDREGKPVLANLGVSAFDKIYQNQGDSTNILTHTFLSSQLNGKIYNPSYYFSYSKGRDEALDLLLLTQGWRTYIWSVENLTKQGDAREQVIFDGIRGHVTINPRSEKKKKEKVFVMAYSPNKDKEKILIQADTAHGFVVPPEQLKKAEGDYVYLKPIWSHRFPPPLKMEDPFEAITRIMNFREVSFPLQNLLTPVNEISDVEVVHGVNVIRDVTIKGKKSKLIRGKYMGQLDSIAKFDLNPDYVCEYNVLNCPRHIHDSFPTTKPVQGGWYYQIIAFKTPNEHMIYACYYMPKYTEEGLLKMHYLSRVKGYYRERKFYQPDYDKVTFEEKVPDFRNTLLWEPSVCTDENGEATLSFFCSDINTEFVGRIEGVGGDGLLGTGFFKFNVRKLKINP
jgi:hypothetical protein